MGLKNKTELQKRIIDAIEGYPMDEVIHAFEVIKVCNIIYEGKL